MLSARNSEKFQTGPAGGRRRSPLGSEARSIYTEEPEDGLSSTCLSSHNRCFLYDCNDTPQSAHVSIKGLQTTGFTMTTSADNVMLTY